METQPDWDDNGNNFRSSKMKVIFSEIAKIELDDACCYYDLEMLGLGAKFKEEVRKTVMRIAEFPTAWSVERGEISVSFRVSL